MAQRDRLVSVTANTGGGAFETPLLDFTGARLMINATVRPGGKLRVGLLDAQGQLLPGRGTEECDPLTSDNRTWDVSWKGVTQVQERGPVKLRIELKDADIFGFQFAR